MHGGRQGGGAAGVGPERGPERAVGSCRRYANHGDLFKRLGRLKQKKQNLPEDAVWIYFIQLCLGVQALHKNNILHRDLKSANVFLASHNRLKIGDLGVAKLLKAQEAYAKTQIGTPYYVSPELWKNKPYNSKSDVWALGCLLCVPRRISRAESDLQPRTFVRRNHKRSSPSVGLGLSAWAALVGLSRHLSACPLPFSFLFSCSIFPCSVSADTKWWSCTRRSTAPTCAVWPRRCCAASTPPSRLATPTRSRT